MMSIDTYLYEIYNRLLGNISGSTRICQLKDVNYNTHSLPDYSDPMVQRYYILRYHYAYAFEYECMFKEIVKEYKDKQRVKILSIGCGNGIDYWGARRAFNNISSNFTIDYIGIDAVDWVDKILSVQGDSVDYNECKLEEANSKIADFKPNVIIFPKSISEIPSADIENLIDSLNLPKKFYMLVSLRDNDSHAENDMRKTSRIVGHLNKLDFLVDNDYNDNHYKRFDENCKGIRGICIDYIYPNEILSFLRELNTKCPIYQMMDRNCFSDCSVKLKRTPILTVNYIKCQIIKFRKRGE